MQTALVLAAKALGRTNPNPMVGAVIVKDGKIIGQGYHQQAGTPHAEIHALREAGPAAEGATLYVTLEPCVHYGRTPPCTDAIIKAGIKHVVIAAMDPNPLVAGRGVETMQKAGIITTVGIMEKEANRLNEVFNKFITTAKPFVVLKCAMSLDGKIATRTGHSQWITGSEARQFGHKLRDQYDAIMVGIGTVLADNPLLTTRLQHSQGKNPLRIILDSNARIPLESKVLVDQSATTLIAVTEQASAHKIAALQAAGASVLVTEAKNGRVDLALLLDELGKRHITSILMEGGAKLAAAAMEEKLVDKVHFFLAPIIIGGHAAPGPVGGQGIARLQEAVKLQDLSMERLGNDLHIEAYVSKENDACSQDS
jgi:diaminohydroxyphosphoribosylaminopyrimidine deaminase/5-amino-6-(5-phosphoribosylamino)uracil reductase